MIRQKNLFTTHYSKFTKRIFAFTLAETLIVMGIIGIVAALTLPNLNSSTANKEKVVKLQKIYQNLNDAYGRAVAVYGPTEEWCSGLSDDNCQKRFFERLTEFMKFSKQCTISDNCRFEFGKNQDTGGQSMYYGVILADGAAIGIAGHSRGYGPIKIDIDGFNRGPNKNCQDYFTLYINSYRKGIVHYADKYDGEYVRTNVSSECAAWILEYGNMDYLKCENDLKFGGKTSCK